MTSRGATKSEANTDTLVKIGLEADLFHSADGTGFADIHLNGHRETWSIRSKGFRRWLGKRYFELTRSAPSAAAVGAALNVVEARAQFEGPVRSVHVRVAGDGECIYLDLADEAWRGVEIGPGGWRIVSDPPVRFRRSAGTLPLPSPVRGGSLETLRSFVNVRAEADFVLVIAWLLAALRHRGPYPLLVLAGEQGSAKSTLAATSVSPRVLAGQLRRAATFLRETGIDVAFARVGRSRNRVITLSRTAV